MRQNKIRKQWHSSVFKKIQSQWSWPLPFAHLYPLLFPTQSRQEEELSSLTAAAYPETPVISSSLSVFLQHILTVQHGVTSTAFMTATKSRDRAEAVAMLELFSEENGRKIKLLQYKDCYKVGMNVLYSRLMFVRWLSFILLGQLYPNFCAFHFMENK